MTSSATPPTGQPVPISPAPGLNDEPTTTVRIRPDVAALPAYVPGARPDAEDSVEIAKLSSNELPFPRRSRWSRPSPAPRPESTATPR